MNQWAGVVLAAGRGTRMNSKLPKPFHTIADIPMLGHVVKCLEQSGISKIVVVVSKDIINFHKDKLKNAAPRATFTVQESDKGSGAAITFAKSACYTADNIVVAYCDVPFVSTATLSSMMKLHTQSVALMTILTGEPKNVIQLGRVIRNSNQELLKIVESKDLNEHQSKIKEANIGWYCFKANWLFSALKRLKPAANSEIRLTDLLQHAVTEHRAKSVKASEPLENLSVNSRVELAEAETAFNTSICRKFMLNGVTIEDPNTTKISPLATIGQDTIIRSCTYILGNTHVGKECRIGPNTLIKNSVVDDFVEITMAHLEGSRVESHAFIGPFCRIRHKSTIGKNAFIGNCAEIKNSTIGSNSHVGHFSYVGDTHMGANANFGAGAVTCNFDGKSKSHTTIGDNAFIGSGSMLIAPVNIGSNAKIGAGSVVNKDVNPYSSVVGVPARPLKLRSKTSHSGGKEVEGI